MIGPALWGVYPTDDPDLIRSCRRRRSEQLIKVVWRSVRRRTTPEEFNEEQVAPARFPLPVVPARSLDGGNRQVAPLARPREPALDSEGLQPALGQAAEAEGSTAQMTEAESGNAGRHHRGRILPQP